jgi:hypothetical protein
MDHADVWPSGFTESPFAIAQSERSQFRASLAVVRLRHASNPKTFRDLHKQRGAFNIGKRGG